jgi:iron complex outermembrane recepter protein
MERVSFTRQAILFIVLLTSTDTRILAQGPNRPPTADSAGQPPKDTAKKYRTLDDVIVNSKKFSTGTLKLPAPARDQPLTLNTINAGVLNQQGSDDYISALRNVSGVNPVMTYGGFSQFVIRGFPDFLLLVDGIRDERESIAESAPLSSTSGVDRIEVLKGPASVLFGHSALGGVINVIRKQPLDQEAYQFSVGYGSYNMRKVAVDAGGPVTDRLSYRATVGLSDDNGWRGAGTDRSNAYGAFNYQFSKSDQLSFQVGFTRDHYRLDAGIPSLNGFIPGSIDLSTRYNTNQDHLDDSQSDLQLIYKHQFSELNPALRLTEDLAYTNDIYHYFSSEELYLSPKMDSVSRGWFQFDTYVKPLQNTLELSDVFHTGSLEHRVVAGHSFNYLDWTRLQDDNLPDSAATIAAVHPFDPQGSIPVVDNDRRILQELSTAVYLHDLISLTDKWKAMVGVRYDYFHGKYRSDLLNAGHADFTDGTATNRTSTALTWRLGLVYQPTHALSLYGSWSTYFKPARQIPTNNIDLKPTTGYQGELGVKVTLNDKLSSTSSVYYIDEKEIVISLPQGAYDQAGEAHSKGVEEDLTYTPNGHWQVIAGYSYTDVRFTNYQESPTVNLKGNRLYFAPDHQANLWTTWYASGKADHKGFNFSLGGNLVGNNYTDNDNTVKLPAYTILNGAIHYRIGRAELGFNGNNLLDKKRYFVSAINTNQLYPGMPFNFLLSARYTL